MAKRTLRADPTERLGNERIIDPDKIRRPAFALFERYASYDGPRHKHCKGQLVYVSEGVMRTETDDGMWVGQPPSRAGTTVPAKPN